MTQANNKVVVIGLDGGTYKILKPLAEEGVMPNFKKILELSSHGILKSTIPPMTGTAWTTFATGKTPGKHGVYDFLLSNGSLTDFRITSSRDIKGKTVYEIISEQGLEPITINLPNSWPPRLKDKHIVITSLLTQGDQWIWPNSLIEEFPELKKYKLTPNESLRMKERQEAYIEEIGQMEHDHLAAVKKIFTTKKWDFFFYLFSATDWLQHARFDEVVNDRDPKSLEIYKIIDGYLGWFLENLPPDTTLLMMSDHGFTSFHKIFYINKWLEKEGYLTSKIGSEQFKTRVTRRGREATKTQSKYKAINLGKSAFKILSYFPWLEKFSFWLYKKFIKKYLPINLKVNIGVDYSKTYACIPKGGHITNVYLNYQKKYHDGIIKTEKEYLKIRTEIKQKLEKLTDASGEKVIEKILTKEDVYGKNAPIDAPDLFFDLKNYWLDGNFYSGKIFNDNQDSNKYHHDMDGIFLALGPNIKSNTELEDNNITDLAPTILHLLNIPIPRDMDGKVITEIFKEQKEIIFETEKQAINNLINDIKF
ncbi:MAG: alkaline phosphatase family protein [Patescibacteria group bacterium]